MRCWTGPGCKCTIQHIKNNKVKMPDILLCPNTYELARGLTLGSHSTPLLVAAAELSEGKFSPSWTARPPHVWRPSSSFSP